MKPVLKIVPRAKKTATGDRHRRVWSNEQLGDVLGQTLQPIDWKLKDELTLAVWKSLTARMPWDKERHIWAELIADSVLDAIEEWKVRY